VLVEVEHLPKLQYSIADLIQTVLRQTVGQLVLHQLLQKQTLVMVVAVVDHQVKVVLLARTVLWC
jgi:regulator of protease activity HflC (stomatin/prohibitin superfamily)